MAPRKTFGKTARLLGSRFFRCDRLPAMLGPIVMRSFVRARAALSLFAASFALLVLARVARADEPAPSMSTASNDETDDARFHRLKAEGDRALAERRLNDAIKAYDAAVKIRRDPLTAGRMGLALSYFDDPRASELAAMFLYEAVRDVAGVYSQEKDAFFAAYKRMRKLVCKVEISTNDANARIDLGKGFKHQLPAFFKFVKRGKGEAIAKLAGREDIHKTWDCAGDHDIEIKFEFPPAVATPAKTITVIEEGKETIKIIREPIPIEKAIADPASNGNRLSVWFGPSVVFGVAPSPAYGFSISGAYKLGNWAMMLGARGAYAFGPIEGNSVDVLAVTGLAGPCTTGQWLYVCGFAVVNVIRLVPAFPLPKDSAIISHVVPGLGIGLGARYSLNPTIALYAHGDAMILSTEVAHRISESNVSRSVWTGHQGLLSLSLGVSFGPNGRTSRKD